MITTRYNINTIMFEKPHIFACDAATVRAIFTIHNNSVDIMCSFYLLNMFLEYCSARGPNNISNKK
jgi:hypothetical protein